MPPGFSHPNYICWDDLPVWEQAKLIAFDQTKFHDENPPPPKKSQTAAPKPRRKRR